MGRPRLLTVAGVDPAGAAGVAADLKTFQQFGCYGMCVVSALTVQDTCAVHAVRPLDAAFVHAQIEALVGDCPPRATKTGMLANAEIAAVVRDAAARGALGPLVVDPVLRATGGEALAADELVVALRGLVAHAAVVTPNADELERLAEERVTDEAGAVRAARRLLRTGVGAVLAKGGHRGDAASAVVDLLVEADGSVLRLERPRIAIERTHGTGCALSAALACGLARGLDVRAASRAAGDFVHRGLAAAFPVGRGGVPIDHGVSTEDLR